MSGQCNKQFQDHLAAFPNMTPIVDSAAPKDLMCHLTCMGQPWNGTVLRCIESIRAEASKWCTLPGCLVAQDYYNVISPTGLWAEASDIKYTDNCLAPLLYLPRLKPTEWSVSNMAQLLVRDRKMPIGTAYCVHPQPRRNGFSGYAINENYQAHASISCLYRSGHVYVIGSDAPTSKRQYFTARIFGTLISSISWQSLRAVMTFVGTFRP